MATKLKSAGQSPAAPSTAVDPDSGTAANPCGTVSPLGETVEKTHVGFDVATERSPTELPLRRGDIVLRELIDLYMAHYAGRDTTRTQRLTWWSAKIGRLRLDALNDDHIHAALEELEAQPPRFFAGKDADGRPIHRAKKKPLAPATLNRYATALSAVITWSIKRRIAPKGFDHPCRRIERRPENNEKTRFLSADERVRLLQACKASSWPRLYVLVLLALTTGARKSELTGLRWSDVDLDLRVVHVGRSKNGDPKVLPLVVAVVEELQALKGADSSLVFASRLIPSKSYTFEPRWTEALKAARIKDFRFHDLRHSCASYLAQSGATLLEIADLLGHRQISMTKRYSHLASTHRAALVNRVLGDLR